MELLKQLLNKSYYKIRIILIFSIFTIVLVIASSRISYLFIKDLYLDQLEDQIKNSSSLISKQIDKTFLNALQLGIPTKTAQQYFFNILNSHKTSINSRLFLFDKSFTALVNVDSSFRTGIVESRLLINKKEILDLAINQFTTSLPFKGDDKKWYMWGFFRLNENCWLCLQESASRLEKVEDFSRTFWYLGIGGILITIILSWFVAQRISKPIDSLVKFSSEIGKGNLSYSPPARLKGEMLILSKALEKMRNDLSKNQKEKENILAQIAHEIRNPLGGIELLANLTKEDLDKEHRNSEYIDRIIKEINGLKALITAFLNYSRPAAANQSWINLSNLFYEIKNLFNNSLKIKSIEFNYEDNIKNIYFDNEHLKHILMNLITNSMESIRKNGKINIKSLIENNKWVILINDNGTGIDSNNSIKIFDPFFTTKKDGTGLGLSICKKLCIENKADLVFNSNGNGTTFKIIKEVINES
jgi:signal transduction histidine kinase